jgi:hypothetical protein
MIQYPILLLVQSRFYCSTPIKDLGNAKMGVLAVGRRLVLTGAVPPPYRRGASGREREGGIHPAGRVQTLSPRSRPLWQGRGGEAGGSEVSGERGEAGVTWRVSIGPRGG